MHTASNVIQKPAARSILTNRFVTLAEIEGIVTRMRRERLPAGATPEILYLHDARINALAELYADLIVRHLPGCRFTELSPSCRMALEIGQVTEEAA